MIPVPMSPTGGYYCMADPWCVGTHKDPAEQCGVRNVEPTLAEKIAEAVENHPTHLVRDHNKWHVYCGMGYRGEPGCRWIAGPFDDKGYARTQGALHTADKIEEVLP
jgi:hypothetical protein